MSTATIRQAPGWWSNLVQVVCNDCGHIGPVHDLNKSQIEDTRVKVERDEHECGEKPWWA